MKKGLLFVFVVISLTVSAADWAQWRCDAEHSAYTPAALPSNLTVQWVREFSPRQQAWPSPLNQYLMQYDRQFEPVVMDGVMVLAFNDADKVIGMDVESGKTLWTFFTDGPVRLAPALWEGKAYVSCDDGFLYCIRVKDGSEVWRFDAAPDRRHALGNRRVISMWPVRGGAVVEEGRVYFSSGIWPFMGVFLYCLDAESGEQIWINDYDGLKYRNQPHSSPAFAGIAPQGVFSVTKDLVLAPGGRSTPGAYDKQTGEEVYYLFSEYSKNNGGDFVAVQDDVHFVRTRASSGIPRYKAWDNASGSPSEQKAQGGVPVLAEGFVFRAGDEWAAEDAIVAGETAYIGGSNFVAAVDLTFSSAVSSNAVSSNAVPRSVVWEEEVEGQVVRLLAASGRLFAVTLEGDIICFGSGKSSKGWKKSFQPLEISEQGRVTVKKLADIAPLDSGYALVWGIGDGVLLEALVAESDYSMVVVDSSTEKIAALREKFDAAGLYGDKVSVHHAPDWVFDVPQHTMSLVLVNDQTDVDLWEAVRPYGGMMLGNGKIRIREGALEGSADWTHNYADVAQTTKSDDFRVKMPLAPLWWGGEAPNTDVLPRHGHGPGELVVGGRLFIQGTDCLSARDVYTGRLLWKRDVPGLNEAGLFYDKTFKSNPLATGYNQIHLPGANLRGGNYVATADRIYLIKGTECLVLDTATGETLSTFTLPRGEEWGYIGVQGDNLIASGGFVQLSSLAQDPENISAKRKVFASQAFDFSCSKHLYVLDRFSGKRRWEEDSEYGFLHNAICASDKTLFCIDRYPFYIEQNLIDLDRSVVASSYVLRAIDLKSGREKWKDSGDVFGTFLSYSKKHDALILSMRASADGPLQAGRKRVAVYDATRGKLLWDKPVSYRSFPLTHSDFLFTRSGAWNIVDGSPLEVSNPITGKTSPWQGYTRKYGCNYPVASEHLLTFRSSTASFYDLRTLDGTGSFGGFKSGCSASLLAANGVLNSPDFTFTCSCAFQTQTSLALIHSPDLDYWTAYNQSIPAGPLKRYALNLAAPGDRRVDDTVWLNYPNADNATPTVPVHVDSNAYWTVHHPFRFGPQELRWVYSSCLENVSTFEMELNETTADFTVRLYFAEPDNVQAGERVFDVTLAGKTVLRDFDVVKAAGTPRRGIMKEVNGVDCSGSLKLEFESRTERGAILSGIELIRE